MGRVSLVSVLIMSSFAEILVRFGICIACTHLCWNKEIYCYLGSVMEDGIKYNDILNVFLGICVEWFCILRKDYSCSCNDR